MFTARMRIVVLLAVALFVVVTAVGVAQATVIADHLYRLGEDDPGAVAGATGNDPTKDAVGATDLARTGAPAYSGTTPGTFSSLSMDFDGTDAKYSVGSVISSLTDNFGVEAWVKKEGGSYGTIAFNGDMGAGSNGWGLILRGGAYQVLYPDVGFIGSAASTGDWTHLALVRDSGTTTFYVNGVANATSGGTPIAPSGTFQIGGKYGAEANPYFNGLIDHVRTFSFTAGEFQVSDLSIPEPSALVLLATGVIGLLAYAWRKRR